VKNFEKKTAIVLFNLGGPDKISAVKPFLFNLFNDNAIINLPQPLRFLLAKFISAKRSKKTQKIYEQIGGKSPLLEITLSQAHSLEYELSFFGNFKVFVAMRYWHPLACEVAKEVEKYQPDQVILLPLYPQFSSATSASSIKNFLQNFSAKIPIKTICCYHEEPDFIKSHTFLIRQKIAEFYDGNFDKLRFLFSAHGLPQKLINKGDPYVFQINQTAAAIVKNLGDVAHVANQLSEKSESFICNNSSSLKMVRNGDLRQSHIDFRICYQSKVGPLQWTQPSLEHELGKAILDKKIPVIIPISFVSEHCETLFELDVKYKNLAYQLGTKNYLRVPALNIEGHFIKALAKMVRNADDLQTKICPKNFKLCFKND